MDDEAWSEEGFTPAGQDTYGRFMRIRLFDTWLHEQDIRDVVDRPGHESGAAVEQTLDEMSGAMGYVVGKLAGAPDGSSVTFDLTGDAARAIHVRVDGRAAVVDALDGPATVTLHMPVGVWVRLAGGRVEPRRGDRSDRCGRRHRHSARRSSISSITRSESPQGGSQIRCEGNSRLSRTSRGRPPKLRRVRLSD